MNIPKIIDIDTALYIYYRYPEIGTKEVARLFSRRSKSSVYRLKKLVRKRMAEDGIYTHGRYNINTECAYKAWGIDIEDLERRRNKLKKLGVRLAVE